MDVPPHYERPMRESLREVCAASAVSPVGRALGARRYAGPCLHQGCEAPEEASPRLYVRMQESPAACQNLRVKPQEIADFFGKLSLMQLL